MHLSFGFMSEKHLNCYLMKYFFNGVFFYWSFLILNWLALHCAVCIHLAYKAIKQHCYCYLWIHFKIRILSYANLRLMQNDNFFKKTSFIESPFIAWDNANCLQKLTKIVYMLRVFDFSLAPQSNLFMHFVVVVITMSL